MHQVVKPRWIVLRRDNGHFEALGPTIAAFENFDAAATRATELSTQHHGQMFAVCQLVRQFALVPIMIEGEVS